MRRVRDWFRKAWDKILWWVLGIVPQEPRVEVPLPEEVPLPGEAPPVPRSVGSGAIVGLQAIPVEASAYADVPWLSVKQTSVLTSLRMPQVRALARSGAFVSWRQGRRLLIWSASALEWM